MKRTARKTALKLIERYGYTQRAAAQKVGVTEKTIGIWVKAYTEENKIRKQNIKLLETRLNTMLSNLQTPESEIQNTIGLIKELTNMLYTINDI